MQIVLNSGRRVSLVKPDLTNVCVDELAWDIAGINRFNSHHEHSLYSVAQHSVLVSHLCPSNVAYAGLMHDIHEAICCDLPSPHKEYLNYYGNNCWKNFENAIAKAVRKRFGLNTHLGSEVKKADKRALSLEVGHLMTPSVRASFRAIGIEVELNEEFNDFLIPMCRNDAYDAFMAAYRRLAP